MLIQSESEVFPAVAVFDAKIPLCLNNIHFPAMIC